MTAERPWRVFASGRYELRSDVMSLRCVTTVSSREAAVQAIERLKAQGRRVRAVHRDTGECIDGRDDG